MFQDRRSIDRGDAVPCRSERAGHNPISDDDAIAHSSGHPFGNDSGNELENESDDAFEDDFMGEDDLPPDYDPEKWDDFGADFDDEEPEPAIGDFWPELDTDEPL